MGRPLCGVAVMVSQNMHIGLQEESDVGVADPLAYHLRAYAGFERTGRVGVPQIMEGDLRRSGLADRLRCGRGVALVTCVAPSGSRGALLVMTGGHRMPAKNGRC